MVARLAELPAPWLADIKVAPGDQGRSGIAPCSTPVPGLLLRERASELEGVTAGGFGISGVEGVALRIDPALCNGQSDCFLRDRVFAVVGNDGDLYLKLPKVIADDLVENGLAVYMGKYVLTWPVENAYQLEVSWRILLHAYWYATGTPEKRTRRMWSEYVIQH